MLYKTITLELIQDRPELHEQLRRSGTLLATMESLAAQLKASYEAWKDHLARAEPNLDLSQVASEAQELALAELEAALPIESDPSEPFSLDAAMAFVRRVTPPA